MLLPATYIRVSSAYLMMREFLRIFTMSFAKTINNKGPKMDPFETQQVSKPDSDSVIVYN